jgi:hypothetical protein
MGPVEPGVSELFKNVVAGVAGGAILAGLALLIPWRLAYGLSFVVLGIGLLVWSAASWPAWVLWIVVPAWVIGFGVLVWHLRRQQEVETKGTAPSTGIHVGKTAQGHRSEDSVIEGFQRGIVDQGRGSRFRGMRIRRRRQRE